MHMHLCYHWHEFPVVVIPSPIAYMYVSQLTWIVEAGAKLAITFSPHRIGQDIARACMELDHKNTTTFVNVHTS